MKRPLLSAFAATLLGSLILPASAALAMPPITPSTLAGTWTLAAADVLHPDGSRTPDFGTAPKGVLMIDRQGHYSLQIFRSDRPRFSGGDKATGSDADYKAAVMGSSTHFGTISVDSARGELIFHIDGASFPNWEGQQQRRQYEWKGDTLSYRVPPRPNGDIPISVWRRADTNMAGH